MLINKRVVKHHRVYCPTEPNVFLVNLPSKVFLSFSETVYLVELKKHDTDDANKDDH